MRRMSVIAEALLPLPDLKRATSRRIPRPCWRSHERVILRVCNVGDREEGHIGLARRGL
jgi:hypothetical protein